jgi:hypothetical protein
MTARINSGAWPLEFLPMAIKAPYRMDKHFCGASIKARGRFADDVNFWREPLFIGE